jgi:hypothetical protein
MHGHAGIATANRVAVQDARNEHAQEGELIHDDSPSGQKD